MGYPVLRFSEDEEREERSRSGSRPQANGGLYVVSRPVLFGSTVPEQSLAGSLFGNMWDAMFPKKQPPLHLTSRPVRVSDPLSVKRDPTSRAISFALHATVIGLILWAGLMPHVRPLPPPVKRITPITFRPYIPPAPKPKAMAGGGGGGAHKIVEPTRGHLPPITKLETNAPQIIKVDHPLLPEQPTIHLPKNIPNNSMPNLGQPNSPQVALASQGSGSNSGFGEGMGGGIGASNGGGLGQGTNGGYGGGVMSVGGGVSAPELVHSVQPGFTNAARAARLQGTVTIELIVDQNGDPQNIQIVKRLGMGLDQKAVQAVEQYRFRPAMYQGHPVPVRLQVQVNFHLY